MFSFRSQEQLVLPHSAQVVSELWAQSWRWWNWRFGEDL